MLNSATDSAPKIYNILLRPTSSLWPKASINIAMGIAHGKGKGSRFWPTAIVNKIATKGSRYGPPFRAAPRTDLEVRSDHIRLLLRVFGIAA